MLIFLYFFYFIYFILSLFLFLLICIEKGKEWGWKNKTDVRTFMIYYQSSVHVYTFFKQTPEHQLFIHQDLQNNFDYFIDSFVYYISLPALDLSDDVLVI